MGRDLIEERLRAALDPAAPAPAPAVDMSAEAITSRVRELAEMSSLCLELASIPPLVTDAGRPPSEGAARGRHM